MTTERETTPDDKEKSRRRNSRKAGAAKKRQPRVILFTTPSCSYCRMAKKYFKTKGVRFREVDVSRDEAAARDMQRRSGQQGVPVIDIGGRLVVGFDKPQIDRLLGLS